MHTYIHIRSGWTGLGLTQSHICMYHSESPLVRDDVSVSLSSLGCQVLPLRLQLSTPLLFLLSHRELVHGQSSIALLDVPAEGRREGWRE